MDALSSMASIAGYEAVLLGAEHSPKMFPMQITAAGTITPAKVFVLGAGVAGLQAIATARRLGALVEAYDIRPVVKEEVESLGARFVELEIEAEAEGQGGYAAAQSRNFIGAKGSWLAERLASADVVITTAAVPGKRAPDSDYYRHDRALTAGSGRHRPGGRKGGNCELTRAGETVGHQGATIVGPVNLPSRAAYHAARCIRRTLQHSSTCSSRAAISRWTWRTRLSKARWSHTRAVSCTQPSSRPQAKETSFGTLIISVTIFVLTVVIGLRDHHENPSDFAHSADVGFERNLGDLGR